MEATLADGQTRQIEVAIQVAPHQVRQAMCGLARLNRQGSPHLLVMVQDITSLRQASDALVTARDAADAATRAKSAFLANMSHEIRTPMNAIVGLSRLALEDHLPPKARTYLDKVHQSSMALMGILDDVLDYSKIEAGQMRVEQVAMNLDEVLARSVDLFSARIEQKGLALDVDVTSDVPRQVLGDPLRLSQIINRGWPDRHSGAKHGPHAGSATSAEVLGDRHRRRDCTPGHRAPVRGFHPGRCIDYPPIRGHRSGLDHLQEAGEHDGRAHRCGQPIGAWQFVLVHPGLARGARRTTDITRLRYATFTV